jgi:excisionase family DNA binding protein
MPSGLRNRGSGSEKNDERRPPTAETNSWPKGLGEVNSSPVTAMDERIPSRKEAASRGRSLHRTHPPGRMAGSRNDGSRLALSQLPEQVLRRPSRRSIEVEPLIKPEDVPMRPNLEKKTVRSVQVPTEQRLLIDRRTAAQYLSISQRSLDYLLAHGELHTRRIGSRVLIPLSELQRYARTDHKRLAS